MSDFNAFKAEWLGHRVGDPLLIGRGETQDTMYQCVSLIKQYWREDYGLTVDWPGNAIDIWYNTNAAILVKFYKVPSSDALQGDIVVLHTLNHTDATEPGHIALATGNVDASTLEILEQNGQTGNGTGLGGDAIRTRYVPKSRVAGLLRPYLVAAPRNIQPVCTYVPEPDVTRVMRTNKQPTNWWNLNIFTDNINDFQSVTTLAQDTRFPIGGYAINNHFPTYKYALSPEDYQRAANGDYSTNNGINCLDLEEIPAPVPVKPYQPPAAPAPIPVATTPYGLVTTVKAYDSATDAANNTNARTTLTKGNYLIYKTAINNCLYIAAIDATLKYWINPADNVVVAPTPLVDKQVEAKTPVVALKPSEVPIGTEADSSWKIMNSFHPDRSPDTYELLIDYTMKEYDGQRGPVSLREGRSINVIGTFVKNGVIFYRPRDYKNDPYFLWWYGIPKFDDNGKPTLKKVIEEPLPEHVADLFRLWREDLRNYLGPAKIWDVILRVKKK